MSDEIDMKYNLLLKDEDRVSNPSYEYQVFWSNFVKMMNHRDSNVTLVWDTRNKLFTKVVCSASKGANS